ncbi:MAG TPA: molybdenum cofactor biosynthesis protein MoaE [Gemmatimonadales bacterium]|nr:molybdenum cofactor biosynthesis protein MoaE [Gemmatimonadales bacterium]
MSFLRDEPLDLGRLVATVSAPERGAVVCFVGTVRDHHEGKSVLRLEYSAYQPMAEAECGRIVAEARNRWDATVALEHRTGVLEAGETSVAIAAAAPHRTAAFAACRYVIEEVKRRVPIWKREHYTDGTVGWVDPTQARRRAVSQAAKDAPAGPTDAAGQDEWGV